jgi:hypothetical protein
MSTLEVLDTLYHKKPKNTSNLWGEKEEIPQFMLTCGRFSRVSQ